MQHMRNTDQPRRSDALDTLGSCGALRSDRHASERARARTSVAVVEARSCLGRDGRRRERSVLLLLEFLGLLLLGVLLLELREETATERGSHTC
jgi:hypothetical protein